jgi:SAM-dependent methyltransferase
MPELPAPTQEQAAHFDYLEGLRRYNYTVHVTGVLEEYERNLASVGQAGPNRPATMTEAAAVIEPTTLYRFAAATQHQAQKMGWAAARRSLDAYTEDLIRVLDDMPAEPLGRLVLDPALELPEYYTEHDTQGLDDIHLVPGGYWGDPLVGPVYERGGALYRMAWRTGYTGSPPGALIAFAKGAPSGECRRILDVGCSFGGLTMALREAYPDAAEVVGIDISAAALRWAHLTAEERGLAIAFEQRDATATGYPDESFDLISGFLLLHELSVEVLDVVMAEAHRLLRPGGHIRFLDMPPYAELAPERAFLQSYDCEGNGEAFWTEFLSRDFKSVLAQHGFVNITDGPLDYDEPSFWGTAALMRTGEFRPENRWVNQADKPHA